MPARKTKPDFTYEDKHGGAVCGIDEVGRGPLAGPVVAAAVVLRRDTLPISVRREINDSKKLNASRRAWLFDEIHRHGDVSIAECSVEEIDTINIFQAAMLAMKKAYEGLVTRPPVALIDGNKAPKIDCTTQTIVKGDTLSLSIAAASIIAKHHRDELMKKYAEEFPHYGWASNAGYGTPEHLKAIEIHGVTWLHRRSFAPISKQLLK
jgi:ribonuclease HII